MMKSAVLAQVQKEQAAGFALKAVWAKVCKVFWLWYQRDRQRHELASLSDSVLKDIGISRSEALREYEKPFWRE